MGEVVPVAAEITAVVVVVTAGTAILSPHGLTAVNVHIQATYRPAISVRDQMLAPEQMDLIDSIDHIEAKRATQTDIIGASARDLIAVILGVTLAA